MKPATQHAEADGIGADSLHSVRIFKKFTERLGPDWVRRHQPLWLSHDRIQTARLVLGAAWIEQHYPELSEVEVPQLSDPSVCDCDALLADLGESVATENDPTPVQIAEPAEPNPAPTVSSAPVDLTTAVGLMPDLGPAFRGYVPLPAMISCSDERDELVRRRVEDIIYLHRIGYRPYLDTSLSGGKYRAMLMGEALDLGQVHDFVAHVSSQHERMTDAHIAVKLLSIPENLQVRLCQLATGAIKSKRRALIKNEPAIRARLLRSVIQTGDRKLERHVPLWGQLWVAQELIRFVRTGKVAPGDECSPQEVGQLLGAMTGKRMERSDVGKKLKTIDSRLGVDR